MLTKRKSNVFILLLLTTIFCTLVFTSCGGSKALTSGDPEYEAQVITIEGLPEGDRQLTVSELRELTQHDLDADYKRTTGLHEKFKMQGPYLTDVLEAAGGDISDYQGIGVQGRDGYYCLLSAEVVQETPDLMLALVIDKKAKLEEGKAPAQLAVQGQFGPYWVKMVEKIILYKEIPEKIITSVWVFDNLAAGITPYKIEYYGSKDESIELEQIFSRLDNVDAKAFFTMKSADGFKKNEALSMVKSRYYLKTKGEDAPTNISPYIKLGMNVKHIAWISTNEDAAIFPDQLAKYLDLKEIKGQKGIPLSEILFETEVAQVSGITFDVLGTKGEKETVSGDILSQGILVSTEDKHAVVWDESLGLSNIDNLMRIRVTKEDLPILEALGSENAEGEPDNGGQETPAPGDKAKQDNSSGDSKKTNNQTTSKTANTKTEAKQNVVLTIKGAGLGTSSQWTLGELKALSPGYAEYTYSMLNNWPTKKFFVGKGVTLESLLAKAGVSSNASAFKFVSTDGFHATLTKEQLLGAQYSYPQLLKGSGAGRGNVKALLAWSWAEDTDSMGKAKEGPLRLVVGQKSLQNINSSVAVKNVSAIEVLTQGTGSWSEPKPSSPPGKVAPGTGISFDYNDLDRVRIHYTLDGTNPTYDSTLYNPSTTYFQPDLIQPIKIESNATLKVLVTGWGKNDSKIFTYNYTVD